MPHRTMKSLLTTTLLTLISLPLASTLSYITAVETADFTDHNTTNPLSVYHSLHWHNLHITPPADNASDPHVGGIYPKAALSDDMLPATALACHDTTTAPAFGAARMSVTYFGSQISLFDLEQFSFGCLRLDTTRSGERVVSTRPQACVLGVKGYPPGRGIDPKSGLQDLRGVKPSMEMTLWFTTPEDVDEQSKVRMVTMTSLNKSWWALGAVTFEAVGDEPVMLCLGGVRYRSYSVTDWGTPGRGIQELRHDEVGLRR